MCFRYCTDPVHVPAEGNLLPLFSRVLYKCHTLTQVGDQLCRKISKWETWWNLHTWITSIAALSSSKTNTSTQVSRMRTKIGWKPSSFSRSVSELTVSGRLPITYVLTFRLWHLLVFPAQILETPYVQHKYNQCFTRLYKLWNFGDM